MADSIVKNKFYENQSLEKAALIYCDMKGKELFRIKLQFNPTEYSLQRELKYKQENGIGQESTPKDAKPERGKLATLSMEIFLDATRSDCNYKIPDCLKKYITDKDGVTNLIDAMAALMKYDKDEHQPHQVRFLWGKMDFLGKMSEMDIHYTMFGGNGMPLRAKVSFTILGDEKKVLQKIASEPKQSPDRSKYRSLGPMDELWMLADKEYDDASLWKAIAKENGILNPRKIDRSRLLKVPSL